MRTIPEEEVEGRLNAHREAVVLLFALAAMNKRLQQDVVALLEERASLTDHQEDPGAVPADGFAAQEAKALEFQGIAEEVRILIEARKDHQEP